MQKIREHWPGDPPPRLSHPQEELLHGSSLVCGQRVGQPNVSYYQPIGEALSANGLTLLTQ